MLKIMLRMMLKVLIYSGIGMAVFYALFLGWYAMKYHRMHDKAFALCREYPVGMPVNARDVVQHAMQAGADLLWVHQWDGVQYTTIYPGINASEALRLMQTGVISQGWEVFRMGGLYLRNSYGCRHSH